MYREHAERLVAGGTRPIAATPPKRSWRRRARKYAKEQRAASGALSTPAGGVTRVPTDWPKPTSRLSTAIKIPEGGSTELGPTSMKGRDQDRPRPTPGRGAHAGGWRSALQLRLRGGRHDHADQTSWPGGMTTSSTRRYRSFCGGCTSAPRFHEFAHLPMILDERRKKMSKRDDAGSVEIYKARGFVPDGVLNYLARLGWSHGDDELFTREELDREVRLVGMRRRKARGTTRRSFSTCKPTTFASSRARRSPGGRDLAVCGWPRRSDGRRPSTGPGGGDGAPARPAPSSRPRDMIDYYFREPPTVRMKRPPRSS